MADYPWDQCIADQMDRYGDMDTARRVCGMIRHKYGKSVKGDITLPDGFDLKAELTAINEVLGVKPAAKAGARHSASDQTHIDKAVEHLVDAGGDHARFHRPEDAILGALGGKPMKADAAITLDIPAFEWAWVKAAGDWELDVLGIPFGGPYNGKDAQRQYFSAKTNLYLDFFKDIPAMYFHSVKPDGKSLQVTPEIIGKAHYDHTDDKGHWFKVVLDKTKALATRVWEAAKKGLARASSGSVQHLVRIASDGEILSWPIAELSLLDTGEGRTAINPYAVALPAAKAVYQSAGIEFPALPDDDEPEAAVSGGVSETPANQSLKGAIEMTTEFDVQKVVAEALAKHDADQAASLAAKATAEKAEKDRVDAAVKAATDKLNADWAAKFRLPGGGPITTQFADTYKYDGLSAAELGLMIDMQSELAAKSTHMAKVSPAAVKALMLKVARLDKEKVSGDTVAYATQALKTAIGADLSDVAIKAATDPMYTGGTTEGAYWVGTAYSNQLWESIRAVPGVAQKIPAVTIPDGYSSEYFPLESTDPTWYKVAEATSSDSALKVPAATIAASQAAVGQKQITVAKMGARVLYTGELTEDSLVNFAPQLRKQLELSGAEKFEAVIIDGHTATSSNINDIGGTTYSGAATTLFLMFNGLRYLGLVGNTANSRSAAGSLSEDDYLDTVKLLGTAGIGGADITKVGFVIDPNVYWKSLKLATLKTKDVWTQATLENGALTRLWNYPIHVSWNMHYMSSDRKANTAGKVDNDTTTNNAYGAILAVRWDSWKLAYKRRMTMETTRIANADTWEIVAMARFGLGYRDTEASAISYYCGV